VDAACFSSTEDLEIFAEELLAGGCTLLQYRNKRGNAGVMLEQARELKKRVGGAGKLIMNDRADLCLAAEFDGVHVGQDDLRRNRCEGLLDPTAGWEFRRIIPGNCRKRIRLPPTISRLGLCFRRPAKSGLIPWSASKECAGRGS
jgi:hypothetical protein